MIKADPIFNPKKISTKKGSTWQGGKPTSKTIKFNDVPKGKQKNMIPVVQEKWVKPQTIEKHPTLKVVQPISESLPLIPGISKSKLKRMRKVDIDNTIMAN